MNSLHTDKYHIRNSFYNLVELSLLARIYEEQCVPARSLKDLNQGSLAQTLLKMKATEKAGVLRVAIFGADVVGFFWQFDGDILAHWVHADHRNSGITESLL